MAKGEPLKFDLDDDDVKLFCEEADEQIELLDASLVRMEGEPDAQLVQQIFRAAHTLKGSSATIGHKKMAALTHAMETVLDAVRRGRRQPTGEVVDALLAGLDALRLLMREVVTRIDSGTETSALEAVLLGLLDSSPTELTSPPAASQGLPPEAQALARQAQEQGHEVLLAQITIAAHCELPGIRCYQVLQELDGLGEIPWTAPARDLIESGAGELRLTALVLDAAGGHVQAALAAVTDVAQVVVATVPHDAEINRQAAQPAASRPHLEVVPSTGAAAAKPAPRKTSASVRIDVERLDGLMNLVGELVIDRTRLHQIREHLRSVLKDANLTELMVNLEETTSHLARVTDELQEEIMRSRMLPVRSVLTRLPRLVRDVASKCGKKVELVTAGEETELDRSVIEEISDPLVHILRNAVDHGVETPEERRALGKPETGSISVTAWNQESSIYLSVKDDGRGLDTAALRRKAIERGLVSREAAEAASEETVLQYIFIAGLSTAKAISDVSGRGVGMDIVRANIERLNGQVTVRSKPGAGTEIVIQLPLTLATTKALMVMANGTVYAMPLVSVTEALAESSADIHSVANYRTLRLRDKLLPLVDLAESLGDPRPGHAPGGRFIVAARHSDKQVAFVVDELLGEQDVVVKSLGDLIGSRKGLTGATILGDGTLGLIIDTASLVAGQPPLTAIA